MSPVAHATINVAAAKLAEPALRRAGGAARIDYRFATLGGLLPDLVDKPLAWVLFRGYFHDSHLYGHTILFGLTLVLLGLLLARRGEMRLLLLGIGALMHLPVDPVVHNASTLLWPLLGTEFDYATPLVPYSGVVDAAIVVGLALAYRRIPVWRERIRRFAFRGELGWDVGADADALPSDRSQMAGDV